MTRRTSRSAFVAALSLPLTGGLLAAAAPVAAGVLQPGDGTVFTVERTVELRADHPRGTSTLSVQGPGSPAVTVASGGDELTGGVLAYGFEVSCWRGGAACTGRVPAPNGTWVVTQSGSAEERISFVLRVPPQAPAGLSATVVDGRQVQLSWQRGAEPDLRGYAVAETGAEATPLPLTVCEQAACSTTMTYHEGQGGERAYSLTAVRSDGGAGTLESAPANTAATLPAATASTPAAAESASPSSSAPPSPSGSPSAGAADTAPPSGSPSAGAADTTAPGASPTSAAGTASPSASASAPAAAQSGRDGLSSRALGPALGLPGVPALPTEQGPQVAPLPEGTFEPTVGLPGQEQVLTERFSAERLPTVVREAFHAERLAQSSAAALVLLLAAAHLQRWLRAGARD